MSNGPLISLLVCTKNSSATLRSTMDTIRAQTYKMVEIIVQDNISSDGTLDLLKSYGDLNIKAVSDSDLGIYDALNKAYERSSGDVIGVLHSDDMLFSCDTLENVASCFTQRNIALVYGDLEFIRRDTEVATRKWLAGDYKAGSLKFGWMPPHTTIFVRRDILEKFSYNRDYIISGDYDWLLRVFSCLTPSEVFYLQQTVTIMRSGGQSNGSLKKFILKRQEDANALTNNGYRLAVLISWLKPLRKIGQLLS
jgi:glycosyltransferase